MEKMVEMKKKLKEEMISSYLKTLCFCLLLVSVNASQARVNILPSTGVVLTATPEQLIQDTINIKPDNNRIKSLQYRLRVLRSNSYKIEPSRVKVHNRFIQNPQTLDQYQTVLSGKEKGNPVKSTFDFTATWKDKPGTYVGSLIPSDGDDAPEIPIKVEIKSKSIISLQPANLTIATSSFKSPIISEVDVLMGSNSPRWELYIEAKNLIKQGSKNKINKDKVFVRIKDKNNPKPWMPLKGRTKVLSGKATPPRVISGLQFRVESELDDSAGTYAGDIKFLIRNIQ